MSLYITPDEIDPTLSKISDNIIEVITYANKSKFYFPYLLKSSNKFNYPLKILGWETEWKGYCTKFIKVYDYLTSLSNKEKYVLFVDAWDVIFVKDYNELINEVLLLDYDLIVSSSVIHDLDKKTKISRYVQNYFTSKIFGSSDLYNTINSGAYLIKISKFIEMIDTIKPTENDDDQIVLTKYIMNNQDNLKYIVDHGKYFFLTINISIDQFKIINNMNSFIVHAHSSSPLDMFLKRIFNEIDEETLNLMRPDQQKQILSRLPYSLSMFLKNNIIEIILLIFGFSLCMKKILSRFLRIVF